jgi:hypothetical protein
MSKRKTQLHSFSLWFGVAASSLWLAMPAAAESEIVRGSIIDDSASSSVAVGNNTETANRRPSAGYSISVDGDVVSGSRTLADKQRKVDLALEDADIQVKFDGLDVKPALNVSTVPVRRTFVGGEEVNFLASLNYKAWIARAEIRIYPDDGREVVAPVIVLPVTQVGVASWRMPSSGTSKFTFVLRVYDAQERYDETIPLSLVRSADGLKPHEPQDAIAPGYGDDRTAYRNIPVYGGSVTVFGSNVATDKPVVVMGERVPVDAEGKFVIQRILPPGDHNVDVHIHGSDGKGLDFKRDINIPSSEWFYVALADLTAGYRWGKDMTDISPGEFDKVYTKGRLAFYLKGKIKGRVLLTAAADTGEDKIQNIFKGLDAKDPRQFLRRIDPDDYYPVYGDDSQAVEDAPTRGKFYVRLERGDSHVMWGNFKTVINGTEFLRNERALYGAQGVYRSEKQAPDGGRTTELSAYAAQPGTLPQRDELRGTGGSAYFLKHQDITIGSETINTEIRDRVTGRVLERKPLRYGVDYDFDYVQGVILLRRPLPSTSAAAGATRPGALGGNPVYLTVAYEFTPAAGEVDGYVYGGRAQQWLGDHVRVGATGMREKTGDANQTLQGADVRLSHSTNTYIEGEYARSKGPGFGLSRSTDGGLTIDDVGAAGSRNRTAEAYRGEVKVSLSDLTRGAVAGDIGAHYHRWEKGFSSLNDQITDRKETWGARGTVELGERASAFASYDESRIAGGKRDREYVAETTIKINDGIAVTPGIRHSSRRDAGDTRDSNGGRTDVGVKLAYARDEDHSVYIFGQATVERSGNRRRNDRGGIGGETKLTEKVSLAAEISEGTAGLGGLAEISYAPTADDRYWLGYRLDPDRANDFDRSYNLTGDDLGTIVAGARHRFNEQFATFAEDSYDLFGDRRTLTQAYGVDYTPTAAWTFTGGAEIGKIIDDTVNETTGVKNSDFDRQAVSLAAGYKGADETFGRIKGEIRFEDSDDDTRDMASYLFAASVGIKSNVDWRFLGNLDAVFSDATVTTRDGKYVEGSVGYAYRPVDNDRLNALVKYTFLYDEPGADQVTVNGTTRGPAQRSHIFSADANYDVTPILTLGAKYGFRIGDIKERDGSSDWEKGSAHLGVLRADLTLVKDWDALVEGRALWVPQSDSVDFGVLAAVYRHVGENFKIGVGYNFGSFSDDLRDLTYDDRGVFINAIGKF